MVPCVDMPDITKRCVNLIERYTPSIYELIIVCDKPGKEMRQWLSHLEAERGVVIITNPEPVGPASAINMGIKAGKGKYIAIVTNDVYVTEGWLEPLWEALKEYPQWGWVASKIIFGDTVMTFGTNACCLYSREAIEKVGLLDETYSGGIGGDDDDLYRRFLLASYEPHGVAKSIAYHPVSSTTLKMLYGDKMSERERPNREMFLNRWNSIGTNWDLIPWV